MAAEPKAVTSIQALSESGLRTMAGRELDQLLRREGRTEERIELLRHMCTSRDGAAYAHTELAKIYEHHLKDIRSALRAAREAFSLARTDDEREAAQKRITRLENKNRKQRSDISCP